MMAWMRLVSALAGVALWALIAAPGAGAQTIPVRSGEHGEFTRFVLDLPRGVTARAMPAQNAVRVVTDTAGARFDLSRAFSRIARTRVQEIRTVPGGIELVLACDCTFEAVRGQRNMFIVDIAGAEDSRIARRFRYDMRFPPQGPRVGELPGLGRLDLAMPLTDGSGLVTDLTPGKGRLAEVAQNEVVQTQPIPVTEPAAPQQTRPDPDPPATPDPAPRLPGALSDLIMPDTTARRARVAEAEAQLIEQLAKAATQGLLDPSLTMRRPEREAPDAGRPPRPVDARPPLRDQGSSVDAQTTIDRDFAERHPLPPRINSEGDACFGEDQLDVATWRGESAFGETLGRLRTSLYGERDIADPDAAMDLARFYIAYGFGAEALQILSDHPSGNVRWHILHSMARIVENGFDAAPGVFHGQADCDTPAALWAVLAHRDPTGDLRVNDAAVLRAVNALPAELRRYLGPILATRLLSIDRKEAADGILRAVDRGLEAPDPAADLAGARTRLALGQPDEAEAQLTEIARSNDPVSVEALVDLIDLLLTNTAEVPDNLISLAEAYAVELRDQPMGIEAARVTALATARMGNPVRALTRLDALRGVEGLDWHDLRSTIVRDLANHDDDLEVLAAAQKIAGDEPDRLAPDAANALAARLGTLGFAGMAHAIISGPAQGQDGIDRRILRARLALEEGRPRRAEAELLGLEGEEAARLRAEAKSMQGDHGGAAQAFSDLSDPARATREAWRAGDWGRVAEAGDTPLSAMAALLENRTDPAATPAPPTESTAAADDAPEPPTEPEGVLGRNRALLDSSTELRETLDRLLDATRVNDGG